MFECIRLENTISSSFVSKKSVTVSSKNYRFELRCDETNLPYPSGNDRPIGLFVKEDAQNYMYQVLMPSDDAYKKIKDYLYLEPTSYQ